MSKSFLVQSLFPMVPIMLRSDFSMRIGSGALRRGSIQAQLKIAVWAFRAQRADYYEYLADLIDATAGTKTLQSIFQDDAQRYGKRIARGVLSNVWRDRFPLAGGDLFSTWFGTLPIEDLLAIQSAQYAGAQALTKTLRQLAEVVRLVDRARASLFRTAFVGVVGILMAIVSVFSIPAFTAQHLRQVFSAVPPEYFALWTRRLFQTSDWLAVSGPYVVPVIFALVGALIWSFPNWVGVWRNAADTWGPWAFYRRVQAVRFISLLAVTLSPRGSNSARLRDAISLQSQGATPWLTEHVTTMVMRLDSGASVMDAMDTGLIDREIWWYFTDLVQTLGLDAALCRTKKRTETNALLKIDRQALYLRWALLLFALTVVLGVALWHLRVFEELRQALNLYYSR